MGRSNTYLVDRARILRPVAELDMGVVSRHKVSDLEPHGDWINARLQPVDGIERREPAQVKLVHSHTLILDKYDASGNEVCPVESDKFEIMVQRDNKMSKVLSGFKTVGAIQEVRKRTTVQSYIVPLALETEF